MASTNFQDFNQNTPIVAVWLNDVNGVVYSPSGLSKSALNSAAAWVRFSVAGGVVTIQQSVNILSVVRGALGSYTINYANPMTTAVNCYGVSMGQAGFTAESAETVNSVTISTTNTANSPFDPTTMSVQIFGAN